MPKIQKVTNPTKRVTDPVLLKQLQRQGIDKDYVEFRQDYAPRSLGKEHSPYAKFYRDLKSGKKFMVVSGLPMVKPDGTKIEAGWYPPIDTPAGRYHTKPNLFLAEVVGREVTLMCLSDQPYGAKKGDKVIYQPQLFLNNGEISPLPETATLLDTDPTNENYHNNVLEWDYGICIRRIRIIEGRFRERWIFYANPNGDVRIRHNQSGNYKLKLGIYAVNDDEEFISASIFNEAEYPFEIGASATYYPDAHEETSSVDGYVERNPIREVWDDIHDLTGTAFNDSSGEGVCFRIEGASLWGWGRMYRSISLFDTSGLPDDAIISAATFSVYGRAKSDNLSITPNLNVYSSNPASNTALEAADYLYTVFGVTPFCDTAITYAGFNDTGYNDLAFNATGIAAISKTSVSKFGLRNANYDVADVEPAWTVSVDSILDCWHTEQGSGYKPKLVVTYGADYTRLATVSLGLDPVASRLANFPRSASPPLGLAPTASRAITIERSVATPLGLAITASRLTNFPRVATKALGLAVSASRTIVISRTSSATMGLAATASRAITIARSSSVVLGLVTTVSRALGIARSAANQLGLSSTASRVAYLTRTASVTLGLYTLAWPYHKIKRLVQTIGTNRSMGDIGTNREVSTTGENREVEDW